MSGLEKSGFGIAHDFYGVKKEQADFPVLCETCLGENPYVRMQRNREGKECRICSRPYTSFRWKAGPKARYKSTIICQTCAKLKNVCQTCLFDLEYGLPVQVRDKLLAETGSQVEVPSHPLNRDYMSARLAQQTADQLPYGKMEDIDYRLRALSRTQPYYRRNAPRVCTFWQKGQCTRGEECPYLHQEMNHDPALVNQNIKDRYTGQDDPVAEKIFRIAASRPIAEEVMPPADPSNTTLFVAGLTKEITEKDLRDAFYGFGELLSIKMYRQQSFAFLCYSQRRSAEEAIKKLCGNLVIKGVKLRVAWSKPQERGDKAGAEEKTLSQTTETAVLPPPLPGLPAIAIPLPVPFPAATAQPLTATAAEFASAFPAAAMGVLPPPSIYGVGGAPAAYASMNPKEAEFYRR